MLVLVGLALSSSVFAQVRYIGPTKYLNNARAVVTHTFDDTTKYVTPTLDALDRYGVKATAFVSTRRQPIEELWPRLRKAIENGHEVGSHSRTHQCHWPDTAEACRELITQAEVEGSRDDILANTPQKHVWAWAYPCGNCAEQEFARAMIAKAGYLVARGYPGEEQDLHNLPDLQTWAPDPFRAAYTQVVQKRGGIAKTGRTDVAELNAKFDEVYRKGGICHFVSHPAWLDFGPESFYERHLAYIGGRKDVWYVPLGPLYAYHRMRESVEVKPAGENRFRVTSSGALPGVAVTLDFAASEAYVAFVSGKPADSHREGERVFVTVEPGITVEFRRR